MQLRPFELIGLEAGGPGVLPLKILKFYIVVGEFQCIFGARNVVSIEGIRHEKVLKMCVIYITITHNYK